MPEYLLPLSVLNAAAPGILNVVFGKDGSHEDAPRWKGPYTYIDPIDEMPRIMMCENLTPMVVRPTFGKRCLLDLRIPAVVCRLAGLCLRAAGDLPQRADLDLCWEIIAEAMDNRIHPETAARMVALTLRLAPEIAALGGQS